MKSFDVLRHEHRVIEQMLDVLDTVAARVESGGAPPFVEDLLDFFQLYADARHHAKEEQRLFPTIAPHGFAPDAGIVEALRHQHEMGRVHVRDMREYLARLRAGDGGARAAFATSAQAYTELLRVHIQIEDDDLYPVAALAISPEEDRQLSRQFEELDQSASALQESARWDRLLAQSRELAAVRSRS